MSVVFDQWMMYQRGRWSSPCSSVSPDHFTAYLSPWLYGLNHNNLSDDILWEWTLNLACGISEAHPGLHLYTSNVSQIVLDFTSLKQCWSLWVYGQGGTEMTSCKWPQRTSDNNISCFRQNIGVLLMFLTLMTSDQGDYLKMDTQNMSNQVPMGVSI